MYHFLFDCEVSFPWGLLLSQFQQFNLASHLSLFRHRGSHVFLPCLVKGTSKALCIGGKVLGSSFMCNLRNSHFRGCFFI